MVDIIVMLLIPLRKKMYFCNISAVFFFSIKLRNYHKLVNNLQQGTQKSLIAKEHV